MKIKNLLLALVVVAFSATLFTSCNKSTPEKAAVECMTAFFKADTTVLKTYVADDETYGFFQLMYAFIPEDALKAMQSSKPDITVKKCDMSEDGNTATITLTIKDVIDFEADEEEGIKMITEPQEEEVIMKKVEGKWVMGE